MSKKAKKKRALPARRPQPKPQTGLMRLEVTTPAQPKPELLPAEIDHNVLGELASVGQLGLVAPTLTAEEEAVLAEDVNAADVLVKPTGQPYLPHAKYRKWFDRALGRFGWSIVPKAKPIKVPLPSKKEDEVSTRHVVLVPYILLVKGLPVAFAYGEQEFNETNAEQTYGDAVEGTNSSAIRRLAKQIGVGLELWDKDWLQNWLDTYAVAVRVKYKSGYITTQWRRKVDKPLPGELAPSAGNTKRDRDQESPDPGYVDAEPVQQRQRPAAGSDNREGEKITQPQRQRLQVIARKAGRNDAEVRLWLKKKWKVDNSKDLTRGVYDQVCRELESKGDLVIPGDGERDAVDK